MSEESQLATVPDKQKAPIITTDRGVQFHSLGEMWRFAELAVSSGIYKDIPTPAVAVIKIQAGAELGLSPVWSLTNIMVVNGRPSVWGDALMGIVLAHPDCQDVIETYDDATKTAKCEVKRKGRVPVVRTFSEEDARKAGLLNKGVHASYPKRMQSMRARAFACRDAFADALRGLSVVEEQQSAAEPKKIEARVVSNDLQLPGDPIVEASAANVAQQAEPGLF